MKGLIKDDYLMYIHLSLAIFLVIPTGFILMTEKYVCNVWNVSLINIKYTKLAVESFNSLEITGFSSHLRGGCIRRLQLKVNQLTREIYFREIVSN